MRHGSPSGRVEERGEPTSSFTSLGEIFNQRSGIVNVGAEGVMAMGVFFGFWAAYGQPLA